MGSGWTIVLGLILGLGLWSIASVIPRLSRPRLAHRVAPYLADVSEGARAFVQRRESSPLPIFGFLFAPVTGVLLSAVTRLLGGSAVIEQRLRQAGSTRTVASFRSRQLTWALVGATTGVILSLALAQLSPLPLVVHAVVVLVFTAAGFLGAEILLQRSARARLARMASELPVVLEFLTLSLSAGESILDSFRRIAATSRGELAAEFGGVVSAVHSGSPLVESLQRLSEGIRMPELTRCVDQLIGALERGTPLTEVLRAQAQDSREQSKRTLLELAGKKEVAMMMPLVFLILPVTIIFAIFPGIFVLQVGF